MNSEFNNLQIGHTYLLSRNNIYILSAKILLVTDKAYHIRWDNGKETWELKDYLHSKYNIIEDISDFLIEEKKTEPIVLTTKTDLVPCYICHGMGTIPDPKSTAGNRTCPACNGGKLVPKQIKVEPKIE
jgi:hypothetical protein